MATKKKSRKKSTTSKKSANKKSKPAQKELTKKRTPPKKSAKRAAAPKQAAAKKAKKKLLTKTKTTSRQVAGARNKKTRKNKQAQEVFGFPRDASRSGEESGDLQGLSNTESADSESVDELVEEGNAFEAGVISGVEEAGDRSEREVRTREVPEDDVPGEYLDED
jgi:hypothetical protein